MTHRLLQAVCLACALGTAATAHAQELGSAEVSLTGLSYRLVDLEPDDGITPSGEFGSGAKFSVIRHGVGVPGPEGEGSGPFSPETFEIVSADGRSRASVSGQDIHISGSVDEAVLRGLVPQQPIFTGFIVKSTQALSPYGWSFTLSPQTAIVVEGQVSLHAALDLSSLVGSDLVTGDAPLFEVRQVSSPFSVAVASLEDRGSGVPVFQQSFIAEAGVNHFLTKDGLSGDPYPDEQKVFSLRWDNTSDQVGKGRIELDAYAS